MGITVFSEVEDSLICPATGTTSAPSPGGYTNGGTLGSDGNAFYFESDVLSNFVVNSSGKINQAVVQNGTGSGHTNGEIVLGTDSSNWNFMHTPTGSNITSMNIWVNGDLDGAPEYPIVSTFEAGTNGLEWGTIGTAQSVWIKENSVSLKGGNQFTGTLPPDDGNWHMLTYVQDLGNTTSNFAFACMDGVCASGGGGITPAGTGGDASVNMTIGAGFCNGLCTENTYSVDDFTVWHGYQLTQSDINSMYNSGAGASSSGIGSSFQVVYHSFDTSAAFGGSPGVTTGGQGSEECEQAKDTAWTVIGIVPVALFFALFAIFGALGRTS